MARDLLSEGRAEEEASSNTRAGRSPPSRSTRPTTGRRAAKSFARWHDETPDGFVFAVKASRFATNRRVLAEAGESIAFFVDSGLAELGPKLGPAAVAVHADQALRCEDDVARLPRVAAEGSRVAIPLRHALDVRHESFRCEAFVDARARSRRRDRLQRLGRLPDDRRRHGRLRLCAPDARAGRRADRLPRRRTSHRLDGRRHARLDGRRDARRDRSGRDGGAEDSRGTRSSSSSTVRRNVRPAGARAMLEALR